MKYQSIILATLALVLLQSSLSGQDFPKDGQWVQLFNGKDLDDWIVKIQGYKLGENYGNTFRVKDGVMQVGYEAYDKFDRKFGHIHYKKPFSNYFLRVEYRFTGEQCNEGPGWAFRNSGVMVHGQDPKTMGIKQDFPVSIEIQLLGGRGTGIRTTSNLCTPGTNVVMKNKLVRRHCTNSTSKTYHGDQWVTAVMEVRGDKYIKHYLDGRVVLEYEKPQLDDKDAEGKKLIKNGVKLLSGGYISLQSESHPVEFRKVEIMELKD